MRCRFWLSSILALPRAGFAQLARIVHLLSAATCSEPVSQRWPRVPGRTVGIHTVWLGIASTALADGLSLRLATKNDERSGLTPVAQLARAELRFAEPALPPFFRTLTSPNKRQAQLTAELAQWSIGELTDEEQKLLELINRARANPMAESARLQNLADPEIQGAYTGFNVDFGVLAADLGPRPVVPPLTPHPQLTAAARGHSQFQLDNAVQAHFETNYLTGQFLNGPGDRITATGYPWISDRESVYSSAKNMEYAHAGFEVDWGGGPGGQQSPPGHRENNHDGFVTEVGVGVLAGNNTRVHGGVSTTVGPRIVTIDFARPQPLQTYLTGVVYYDLNGDGEYDEGEGFPGVQIEVSDSGYFAKSAFAGGYAVPTEAGAHTVTFTAEGLPTVTRQITVLGTDSVKVDLALPYAAPLLTGSPTPVVGFVNKYQPTAFPNVTAYDWRATRRTLYTTVLGAESGVDGFTAATSAGYSPRTTSTHAHGGASYRLAHPDGENQLLTQTTELMAQANATLEFNYRFGFSTETEDASVEISTDGGASWSSIWAQSGLGQNALPQSTFQGLSVPIGLPAGTAFKTRFRYSVQLRGFFFNSTSDDRLGFFFDDVRYSGVFEVTAAGGGEAVAGMAVGFVPAAVGDYVLQVRPKLGNRVFPYGGSITVSAQTGVAPIDAVTRIGTVLIGPSGKMRIDFSVVSGMATGFDLERAGNLGASWATDPTATLTLNSPGNYSFKQIVPSGTAGFFRIRAK